MKCDWCGRNINGNYVSGGLFGPYYCSNKCKHDAEASKRKNDDYYDDDDDTQSLGFFGKIWRAIKITVSALVILTIIGYILDKDDDDKKSDDNKKTEQTSTQTAKKQSSTSAKNTNSSKTASSSKPVSSNTTTTSSSKTTTTQSSNSQASSNSGSITPSIEQTNTVATSRSVATPKSTTTESDASHQTYLALSTLLESEGKSLKLCEAQKQTKGQEANVIGKMNQLRGTKYYSNALKDLVKYCPKYANEYSKNGKYFASEAEFYQAYIAPDYSKTLKAKKKENK